MNNNNTIAIESFITFCDDMMIAEEGFKDIGKSILNAINKVWQWFLKILKKAKDKIKSLFKKDKGEDKTTSKDPKEVKAQINTNEKKIKELEDEIKRLKSGKEESDQSMADAHRQLNEMQLDRNRYRAQSEGKDTRIKNSQIKIKELEQKITDLENTNKDIKAEYAKEKEDAEWTNKWRDKEYFDYDKMKITLNAMSDYGNHLCQTCQMFDSVIDRLMRAVIKISNDDESEIKRQVRLVDVVMRERMKAFEYYHKAFIKTLSNAPRPSSLQNTLASSGLEFSIGAKKYLEKSKKSFEKMTSIAESLKNDQNKYSMIMIAIRHVQPIWNELIDQSAKLTNPLSLREEAGTYRRR